MDNADDYENLSCAAYHASSNLDDEARDCTTSTELPAILVYEDAKSVAMIRHGIDIMKIAVDILNPGQSGQVPIITADQPLYTLCKKCSWPDR